MRIDLMYAPFIKTEFHLKELKKNKHIKYLYVQIFGKSSVQTYCTW